MGKIVKKRFEFLVEQPEADVSKSFELDKTIKYVTGLLLAADRDDLLFYRGSQKVEINKEEFFPDGYESKLLMSGINVAPNDRFYDLGKVEAGNGIVKITYKDVENFMTRFEPYRVSVYVACELG